MAAIVLSGSPAVIPSSKGPEQTLHAKKNAFRWTKPKSNEDPIVTSSQFGKSASVPCGARSASPSYALTSGTLSPHPKSGENFFQRQTSLPAKPESFEQRIPFNELKGILKRSRCLSEAPGESISDYESCGSSSPTNFDFFYEFRSTDEIYSTEHEGDWKKRVSFSEKIMKNTYRPGTCILQQKQKAQKRKEKRQNKDRRRTVSESDVADLAATTTNLKELNMFKNTEYDSGVEGEVFSPCLEEVAEASEEELPQVSPNNSGKARKKRHHKRKNQSK